MTGNPAATDDAAESLRSRIGTSQPHTARIWNYWLGGKDNYEADRAAGDRMRQLHPGIGEYARADRLFPGRAVRRLVAEAGIRQFLDPGLQRAGGADPARRGHLHRRWRRIRTVWYGS
ncbi:SAM-dependent methyltransferase [Streptomyces camelliae]|uniref:SAM-dependent methyltransferase n=1 Tax=Streptomyces camelliae TaxID=3004093 RepID=A0ABY7NVH2_9ACTN|nr:SAM-dependent methyltransferase [Streptomyces sp. HUAS 2-6]WBO62243.1 SAM-dependent methyltransferase [Streptomyces sp. HUAS 2-6]